MTASDRPAIETASGSQRRAGIAVLLALIGISWLDNLIAIPRIAQVLPKSSPEWLTVSGRGIGRLRNFREQVAHESLDELVGHWYSVEAYQQPLTHKMMIQVDVFDVLRSPRLWKLKDLLSQLPRDEALARSRALCEATRTRWLAVVDTVLTSYERSDAPTNKEVWLGVKGAYGAAIIVLAHFADFDEVVAEVRRSTEQYDQCATRIDAVRGTDPQGNFLRYGLCLGANFHINAIAFALNRGPEKDKRRNPRISELLARLPTTRVTFLRWDAPQPPPEPAFGYRNATTDSAPAAQDCEELEVYHWQFSSHFARNEERILRELLQVCTE